jgi:hypothetical protein
MASASAASGQGRPARAGHEGRGPRGPEQLMNARPAASPAVALDQRPPGASTSTLGRAGSGRPGPPSGHTGVGPAVPTMSRRLTQSSDGRLA